MQFFIDSGKVDEVRECLKTGLVAGVTTNPVLLGREGGVSLSGLKSLCDIVSGPVSLQVTVSDLEGMRAQAAKLSELAPNVVVKLPITVEGLQVCRELTQAGVAVNMTFCFSPVQALLAAQSGATYVSPFVGRLNVVGGNGEELIADIRTIFDQYGFSTQILAASIRSVEHVQAVSLAGADIATLPIKVFWDLFTHPLTDQALETVHPHKDLWEGIFRSQD
jgi:transaldolase